MSIEFSLISDLVKLIVINTKMNPERVGMRKDFTKFDLGQIYARLGILFCLFYEMGFLGMIT